MIDEHVMISRAELAEIIMKAKGFDPEQYELVNLDFQSTTHQQILEIYKGKWTDAECPFDIMSFGVKKHEEETEGCSKSEDSSCS
jgi:hypothetical protein